MPNRTARPGFGKQAAGCGCGALILVAAVLSFGLIWLVLLALVAGVPTPNDLVRNGPPGGRGWLVVSTIVAVLACVAALPLMFISTMAFDAHRGPLPGRAHLWVLLFVLPALGLVAVVSAWISYALGAGDAARYLESGPWVAGLGLIATMAVLFSAASAYES